MSTSARLATLSLGLSCTLTLTLPLALTLALGGTASAKVSEDFERVVAFDPGGSFRIENQNGSIEIATWSETNVKIVAQKSASSEEALKDLEIVVEGSGGDVSVRTLYHRRNGFWGRGGEVSYRVLLPAEAQVTVKTVNGGVTVGGIHGRVEAESVNGAIQVENIEGEIEAETTNGSIRASYESAADGTHRFETTNGSVRISLPVNAVGELDAETVNGSIETELPITLVRSNRRHVRGSFGNGAGSGSGATSFKVSTVNGSVTILSH
jgi:DUF4097 and DUF4098 domain-containing protein YvlB